MLLNHSSHAFLLKIEQIPYSRNRITQFTVINSFVVITGNEQFALIKVKIDSFDHSLATNADRIHQHRRFLSNQTTLYRAEIERKNFAFPCADISNFGWLVNSEDGRSASAHRTR
jgi:hypothetical protein